MSSSGNVCPIFPVSSVSGKGFDQLTDFISILSAPVIPLK